MTIAGCHIHLRGADASDEAIGHILAGLAWAGEQEPVQDGLYAVLLRDRDLDATINVEAGSPRAAACLAATYESAEEEASLAETLDRILEVSLCIREADWMPARRPPEGLAA